METYAVLGVLVGILTLIYIWLKGRNKNLPPGPINWPIIGCLPSILLWNPRLADFVHDCQKKYGDIVFIPPYSVCVYNLDLIRKVFVQNGEASSGRPVNDWLVNELTKSKGIVYNHTSWKDTRKFVSTGMKGLGLGKDNIEEHIQEEAKELCGAIEKRSGQEFDASDIVMMAVSNILSHIVFGKRYKYNDEEFAELLQQVKKLFESNFTGHFLNNFPYLRHLGFLFSSCNFNTIADKHKSILQYLKKKITEHRKSFDAENVRDIIDLYLKEEIDGFVENPSLDEDQLFHSIIDLILAGTDTSTGSIRWNLLYMINYPQVQKKCRQEILQVLGTSKMVKYADRQQMPYLMATLQEITRLSPVAVGTLPHLLSKPLKLAGYTIPANMRIFALTIGMYLDPKIWGKDAALFNPERWLDADGTLKKFSEFIPFGIGKRVCIGEQLAKTEIFIFTVTLLQRFVFKAVDPENPPPIHGQQGLTYVPDAFSLVVEAVDDH